VTQNIAAIFFDLGDTIMDEATEIKDTQGTTQSVELIEGMADALHWLYARHYRLALVADTRPGTPVNVLRQHGLLELFEVLSISEEVGAEKPHPDLFLHALQGMHIPEQEYPQVLMVGNNLERDILGANRLGLRSVYFHTHDRRRSIVLNPQEAPRHTVTSARELLDLVEALSVEAPGDRIPGGLGNSQDIALASRFAPVIHFDEAEPFFPLAVGYTIFHSEEQSPSFYRRIERGWRPDWSLAIEYALWWDWDIGHLYELEHVWVYINETGQLVWVEASSHGAYASMILEDGTIPLEEGHPVVYSQPGKHAFSPTPHWFRIFRDMVYAETSANAGEGGVLVKQMYARQITKTPEADAHVAAWLCENAFQPTMEFNRLFRVTPEMLVPWPVLDAWIPRRVNWWIGRLC
jgi:phosphoglycolate phosphatase-like HAD superfamily hydrolase